MVATMIKKSKSLLGIRHVQLLMLFLAMVLAFSMRVNMSMAIVAMTDKSNEKSFDWSIQTQSIILSSYLWGYVVLQIPGGELAARFGGMVLVTISIGINSAVSLLIPIASYYGGWQLVCFCRVLQGLSQGFLCPSVHTLLGKWAPLEEKSSMATLVYGGGQLGTALQLILSGFIADYWGWPGIFYVNGALGAIWTTVYVFIGSNSPQTSRMITTEERLYIQNSLGQVGGHKNLKTPWKTLLTSLPFLSIIVANAGFNWGFWSLLTEMPTYLNSVMGVDIKSNGVVSALPYLAMYLMCFPFGFVSDYIIKKKWLSVTTMRKLSNSIGTFGPAITLIGLAYTPAGYINTAIVLLTVGVGLNAGAYAGFLLVHLDMAPNFAGTMMGITNGIGSLVSILAPIAAGAMLKDEAEVSQWRLVFMVSAVLYIACNIFYVTVGTSQKQKWNDPEIENVINSDATSEEKGEPAV